MTYCIMAFYVTYLCLATIEFYNVITDNTIHNFSEMSTLIN